MHLLEVVDSADLRDPQHRDHRLAAFLRDRGNPVGIAMSVETVVEDVTRSKEVSGKIWRIIIGLEGV